MSLDRRRWDQAVLVSILVGVHVVVIWWCFHKRAEAPPAPYLGVPEQRSKIDAIIAQLKTETFEQSIDQLTDSQSYHYPDFQSPRKLAQSNLEEMLSNRRSVKILYELDQCKQNERDARCRTMFETMLQAHSDAFGAALRHAEDPTAPENKQSLRATQLALCAVVFATANYGSSRQVLEQIAQLDGFQAEIEQRLAERSDSYPKSFTLVVRRYCAPDKRFQMNVLRLVAARIDGDQSDSVQRINQECSSYPETAIPIVAWDAHTTSFDIPHRIEGIPIDTSKGVKTYDFVDWPGEILMDTDAQRQVVERIRKIVAARN